jgi:tRNA U34 5-methylaminomethyl-2-thiouridine-forming methyltransferase MnmC
VQNELWTDEIFASLYASMKNGGVLCTYSAKGILRRRLQACGFKVERLQGACGKREMLRAVKME